MEKSNGSLKPGEIVYICDYRFNDVQNKPIRHVRPTKVIVISNKDLPKNKDVYYSETHFRPFGSKGKILSKVIAPFDNTGYRSRTGGCVNIFDNIDECEAKYNQQCELAIEKLEDGKVRSIARFNVLIKEIKNSMYESE